MRPIWLEHPSRDVQRFISQLANGGQQACIRQTQNWLIWRHYPAGKRLVPHRKYSATGILESGRYPPHCVISRRLEQRARRPADLYFRKRPSIEGYCRTDRGDRRVVTVAHTVQRTAPDGATAESEVSAAL